MTVLLILKIHLCTENGKRMFAESGQHMFLLFISIISEMQCYPILQKIIKKILMDGRMQS